MTNKRDHGFPILSLSSLALAASAAVYAVLWSHPWMLAVAVPLACLSALTLARAWCVRIAGALLLCMGLTTTVTSAAALWAIRQRAVSAAPTAPGAAMQPQAATIRACQTGTRHRGGADERLQRSHDSSR